MACNESLFKELTDINIRKELYEHRIQSIEQEIAPFGFINDGLEEEMTYQDASGQVWTESKSEFL